MMVDALTALLVAAPASAVSVLGVETSGANSASVVTAEPGLLEIDFLFANTKPTRVLLEGDESIAFNAVMDFLVGVSHGANVRDLKLSLDGAVFTALGTVTPAFSEAEVMLNADANQLMIRFRPDGEGFGVILGNVFGGENFAIMPRASVGRYLLSVQAVVPEPASWAMMIAGFGVAGAALRRRERLLRA